MKVKVTLKNGFETTLDDVRTIKPLVNENTIIIVYKKPKVKWYIDKSVLKNIESKNYRK